ncbi:hypothetical protein COU75_02720 [Candidatus Peregrinibacteria bacterium CG10_big_fil_rev_8_21_14_0_10_42_8]|nr:MAG: hypothetical protein COU75_02720 [Candidatus Peregrinibacteria bacterium CG10_big_fil_rev_8_21_14_0_10_42_8]
MASTLAIIEKEQPKEAKETQLQYLDRVRQEAYRKLYEKKRTKKEEEEFKDIEKKCLGWAAINTPQIPVGFADEDLKLGVERIYEELEDQFGTDTAPKRILIHRLTNAWNQAWSYERMFKCVKYNQNDDGSYKFNWAAERTKYLAELRRGIESANDQIVRLTQALQNLVSPPIQIRAKNAIVAQNMQINQGTASPKKSDEQP